MLAWKSEPGSLAHCHSAARWLGPEKSEVPGTVEVTLEVHVFTRELVKHKTHLFLRLRKPRLGLSMGCLWQLPELQSAQTQVMPEIRAALSASNSE